MADWQLWLPPALTKPRFRLYVAGHSVSVIGGWIQQVALSWLVFRLTGSIFLLGLTGFLLNIFYLLLGPLAGLAADRLPRLPALIAIDLVLAALAVLLAVMGLAGVTDIAAYLAIAALIGIANAFEMPMRQTLLKEMVEERTLMTSAIAMSALVFNLGRMVGPAIGGVLLVYVQEAWCFAINALSYGAIIAALLAMRLPPRPRRQPRRRHARGLRRQPGRARLVPGRALPAADHDRHRPVRHRLRAADAVHRRALLRRPVLHRRPADERRRRRRARRLDLPRPAAGLRPAAAPRHRRPAGGRRIARRASPGRAACRCRCCCWVRWRRRC